MGLIDDLGTKSADVIHDLTKKTGSIPDAVRLRLRISEEEKNIKSLYIQIGKTYFHLCAEDGDERFSSEISGIRDSMAKIEECKAELNLLNGVKVCPVCGHEIPIGNNFCTNCGNRFDGFADEEINKKVCKNCGKSIDKSSAFCSYCGSKAD